MKTLTLTILFALICMVSHAQEFTLTSTDLTGQIRLKQVFNACGGENISPQLAWKNTPEGTKSFAITLYDPDAPTGSGWWHWVMFNIPVLDTNLVANAGNPESGLSPKGSIQSINSFGKTGYGGACPPEGDKPHAYIFTVYALSIEEIDLDANSQPAMLGYYLNANVIQKASLIAYYQH